MIEFNRLRPLTITDRADRCGQTPRSIVAASFAYASDEERYEAYCKDLGASAAYRLRWPFRRFVAGAWVVIHLPSFDDKPEVEAFQSRVQPDYDETDIVEAFFECLEGAACDPSHVAQLVSWGDRDADILSLRRAAEMRDMLLPPQLRSYEGAAAHRLDLSELTFDGREKVHLAEYVRGPELAGIPIPGGYVPDLVKQGEWAAVEEHCAADAMLTAICAARHWASEGVIGQAGAACTEAIVDQFCRRPVTPYIRDLSNWHAGLRDDPRSDEPGSE